MDKLFAPLDLANLSLPNRIVMAPMTRSRAANGVADVLTSRYYSQRASAGLIISEGIAVSQQGTGYLFTPGLYTDDQVEAWKGVTDAVHAQGGRIYAQLWHVGRVSHDSLLDGDAPVSPVARPAIDACAYGWTAPGVPGQVAASEPRALETNEITAIVGDFVASATHAIQAGFDGVEVDAGNGYLFEQFINGELNNRVDCYGGTIENRLRLLLETIDCVSQAIGVHRVGVRISPFGRTNDMHSFEDEADTWLALAAEFGQRELAYVHLSDQQVISAECESDFFLHFRKAYSGTLIVAGGFDQQSAETALQDGKADLIGFGSPFIANPDLAERMSHGWPLAQAERETFYGLHGARGYTDYPRYDMQCDGALPIPTVSTNCPLIDNAQSVIRQPELSLTDSGSRAILTTVRDDFFTAWSDASWHALSPVLAEDALLTSSQHGEGTGEDDWRRLLAADADALVWMRTSNHAIVVGRRGRAAASAYVIGLFGQGQRQFLFGASVVLGFQRHRDGWLLTRARIHVNWCKGVLTLATHWRMPPSDEGWQLGDPPPTIVSELHSPWALIGDALAYGDVNDAVRELYSKYSWAIDQGDIALLSDCYTEDASGGFTPMGPLQGRHAIVGQLKSFRRQWPWMQHFADVVRLELEADGVHARMIVARIISERPVDAQGRALYGAHYQIRARREDDGQWRICWSDYRPGWFTAADVPGFEIGVTHA
jgi:2,4-dienoyl-CoA reductase-like NADH-dependent reductase (Old Yellow Enzyme family)/ketosteroid isomerase-like protein